VGTIQLAYYSGYSSLWEYADALESGAVDFSAVLSGRCPLCGRRGCLRELTPYGRWAISLFPYEKRWILVARFLCRKTKLTVSLLPLELAPYHPYSIPSMLWVLWLCGKGLESREGCGILRVLLDAVRDTDDVTESLVGFWVEMILRGFHRAHPMLRALHDLSGVTSGRGLPCRVLEVGVYLRSCRVRGPPALVGDVMALLRDVSARRHRFLFGIPSQDRRRQGK